MDVMGIDIGQIAHLGTQVATTGGVRGFEVMADDLWELLIAIVIIIYEMDPG
ncbi:MAG: hypothetical protein V4459_08115 [Pseudomonadota bacterium]